VESRSSCEEQGQGTVALRHAFSDLVAELEFYHGGSRRTAGNNKGKEFVTFILKGNTRRLSIC
jgi:hypothetical protein